ncbi:Gar1/Naf1 RNA binding region-domain-containing protein [Phycomyces blakesleeanus]|uniref:H/ACA ribonucleoprotein complex subunit n=1 Tax=Phycomyces blakesleeanus TaxID=4837 RepID=A0ABR3AVM2_PHYBL
METDVEDFVTSIIGGNAPTENKNAEENATKDVLDTAIAAADVTTTGYESSDLEMSSDEDSDSSDESDEEVSGEAKTELYDDEDEEPAGTTELRTTNEIVEVVIEKPNYILTPQTEIIAIGTIHNVINNVIVVQTTPGSVFALDIGTLFVYGDRELMGEVFETFGPVQRPFYSVRYNKAEEIDKERAVVGARVFFVPSYERTNVIQVEALKKIKGTDASNIYDEEAGEDVKYLIYKHKDVVNSTSSSILYSFAYRNLSSLTMRKKWNTRKA